MFCFLPAVHLFLNVFANLISKDTHLKFEISKIEQLFRVFLLELLIVLLYYCCFKFFP